ncbi:MAG: hypothetical protein QG635_2481 [Bacteroidota bacterium]|nr:hypothetical protein [Bacteroidota bacterium]
MNKPQSLSGALEDVIRTLGLEDDVLEERIKQAWTDIVGEKISEIAKVKKFEKGKLIITTESSTWRAELTLRRDKLREDINKKIGKLGVTDIIVR